MKNLYIFIYLIALLSICCSCTHNTVKNEFYQKLKNKCSIQYVGKKEIPVDENVSISTLYIQYIDDEDLLSIYNAPNNCIYFFDYNQCAYRNQMCFEKEGSNGVGIIQGYYFHNKDSVFVYNYNTQTIYLTDVTSRVIWKKFLPIRELQSSDFIPSFPYLQTNSPMVYINQKIVMGGFGTTETTAETATNRPVTTIYDFKCDSVFLANNYPEQYQLYNWGGGFYRMPYFSVNKEQKNIVLSFPHDHNLYVYSLSDTTRTPYYAGSNEIKKIDAYYEKKELYDHNDQNRVRDWFFSISTYRSVLYDKYRNLYYRLACLPESDKLKKFTSGTQPIIVIVLDENFNYIGEDRLPDDIDLRYTNSFVTKDGLNMQVLTDNDDLMTFYQFKVDIHE